MNESLTLAEKQFLQQVLNELKHEQINSEDRDTIKQQLLEHFQEAHDHGEDSLETLGDPTTFVKDFFDVHGMAPHSAIKKNPNSRSAFIVATLTFITTFLTSQFILSLVPFNRNIRIHFSNTIFCITSRSILGGITCY
ncbi:hypothetical protein P4637_06910 [Halalkalibacterium halodurans]|uniref:BH0716 protein n=1 Tax=Halalkalibacterium halodurans (strain ATCC BAA-125 / DSM 18197 / FERM 7344 / JCM 9153 / C-125) TaxID=272558 RepID=Q9KEY3_HALH5|nr:hypothetical protein [Halalkalibacterium halodurans]MED4080342.1 hypothetical protein [Halalkalibacterium halodurans]MED4084594.1 hypothetical protein [Halalkalibacterium halodurans]MED4104842.1 hypothetical protein [Halalkalibacterium halodurans]MED4109717.1 hypothetical protein [Halalkalibacterium halodurans]MED4122953.1 hypothetical protein [Halalkalibacterium halodurans]